jgi:hypothetical protein
MPFPIAYPTDVGCWPAKVKVRRERSQANFDNEFTLQTQVQLYAAKRYWIDVVLQPMDRADAATFDTFLNTLNGLEGSFNFDLSPWSRGALPGVRIFRMATPNDEWDAEYSTEFGYAFSAYELI